MARVAVGKGVGCGRERMVDERLRSIVEMEHAVGSVELSVWKTGKYWLAGCLST